MQPASIAAKLEFWSDRVTPPWDSRELILTEPQFEEFRHFEKSLEDGMYGWMRDVFYFKPGNDSQQLVTSCLGQQHTLTPKELHQELLDFWVLFAYEFYALEHLEIELCHLNMTAMEFQRRCEQPCMEAKVILTLRDDFETFLKSLTPEDTHSDKIILLRPDSNVAHHTSEHSWLSWLWGFLSFKT